MKIFTLVLLCASCCFSLPMTKHESPLWTRSGKVEGDMVLTPQQLAALRGQRNGLINPLNRWPSRTIPYKLRDGDFTAAQAAVIRSALDQYNNRTCLVVREAKTSDRHYVLVTNEDSGCWSYVGKQGGTQQLNLMERSHGSCLHAYVIVHEFMHAAGFYHQQSASNRDLYVTINWKNIQSGQEYNFQKYTILTVTDFGVGYDYQSVLHYDAYALSKNGLPTIVAKKNTSDQLGNYLGLSDKDVKKLNKMYSCW